MDKKNIKTKSTNSVSTNLPLSEYYDQLPTAKRLVIHAPKEEFLNEIATLTGRTAETVRRWCIGGIKPPMHVQKRIAKHLKSKPEILFPE